MKKICIKKIWIISLIAFVSPLVAQASDQPAFRVVYFDNYAPYSWRDESGNMRGIFIDILDEVIGKRLQRAVEHEGFPWARAQKYVRSGEYDAMIAPITEERASYTDISELAVLTSRMALFTRASHPEISVFENTRSLVDIRTYNFVTQLGDGWAAENLEQMKVQYAKDLDTVLRMLSQGRADLFVEVAEVTHWNMRNLNLGAEIVEVDGVTIEETPYHLMISKKSSQQLLAEFDASLRQFIADGALGKLLEKYM